MSAPDLYWWHQTVLRELRRVEQFYPKTCELSGATIYGHSAGMFKPFGFTRPDSARYCQELVSAGLARVAGVGEYGPEYRIAS